jgi:trans-aconitate methyltransferase
MLAKAEQNAKSENLENITFHLQDITKLETEKKYDVITCSYALFFLPDAHKVLKKLLSLLTDNGLVIFTTFTTQAFTPSNEILLELMREHGSATAHEYEMDRWENLKECKDIERLCKLSETQNSDIVSKTIRYDMSLDEWWELLNNTGYKGMLMELSTEDYEKVKQGYYGEMFKHANMDGEVELIADSHFVVVS